MNHFVDEDFRGVNGKWVLQWGANGDFFMTRLGRLHNNMTQRANKTGRSQSKFHPSYIGVEVSDEFKDPQKFSDWAVTQVGYDLGYQLDKDLLKPGNRTYCAEHCVFLPGKVNTLISNINRRKGLAGAYPKKDGWYSKITVDRVDRKLGDFPTEEAAHEAYCQYKEEVVRALAQQYRDTIDPRAYNALMMWTVK